jgi:hypothetical protein
MSDSFKIKNGHSREGVERMSVSFKPIGKLSMYISVMMKLELAGGERG